MIRTPLLHASLALALAAAATTASAQVANGDFSAGLSAWSVVGDASARAADAATPSRLWLTTASADFADDLGTGFDAPGARNASGVSALFVGAPGGVEDFVGVPLGALDPAPAAGLVAYEGSAARQTFTASAGGTLSFRWDLGTLDGAQPDAAFVVVDGTLYGLGTAAQATLPGTEGNAADTGWQTFRLALGAGGPHTVAFGVVDVGDYDGTSTLAVTDVAVSSVPEPANAALLAAGLAMIGAASRRARRRD